jgi:hypothetical protein
MSEHTSASPEPATHLCLAAPLAFPLSARYCVAHRAREGWIGAQATIRPASTPVGSPAPVTAKEVLCER